MLVRDVSEHVLIVGVFGKGIYSLFEVEEMSEEEVVVGCAGLYIEV